VTSTYSLRRVAGRRGGTHARAGGATACDGADSVDDPFLPGGSGDGAGRWAFGDPWMDRPDSPRSNDEPQMHADDYPSWPGRPGPYALHPDHPSWPGRQDPRWPVIEAALLENDHPSWPERQAPPWPRAEPPVQGKNPGSPGGSSGPRPELPPASLRGPRYSPAPLPEPPLPARVRMDFAPRAGFAPRTGLAPLPDYPPPARFAPRPDHAPRPDYAARTDFAPRADYPPRADYANRPYYAPRADYANRPYDAPQPDCAPRADYSPGTALAPRARPMYQGQSAGVLDRVQPAAGLAWPEAALVRPEPAPVWDVGSAQLASWILTEANQQAAEITHEARDQAATSLADARHEAAELKRRASETAAATLAAAELQAARVRAAITKLSGELGAVAAYVTENLLTSAPPAMMPAAMPTATPATTPPAVPSDTSPAAEPETEAQARPAARAAAAPGTRPAGRPGTRPATKPDAQPAAQPTARPGTRPITRPTTRPKTQPATKRKGRTRQQVAFRVSAVAASALVAFSLVSGATEVAQHGFPFFVFRSAGTGETGPQGLAEDQGPGQPDAPKPTLASQPTHVPQHATKAARTAHRHQHKATPA